MAIRVGRIGMPAVHLRTLTTVDRPKVRGLAFQADLPTEGRGFQFDLVAADDISMMEHSVSSTRILSPSQT